jgi:ABC-type Mn2+/Zn2+ transport system ATPase subunit
MAAQLTLDVREQALVLRVVADEALQRAAHHGVLAHEHDALAAERLADLVHLLRRHIVDGDDEDALVLLEEHLELVEVSGLGFFLAPHYVRS